MNEDDEIPIFARVRYGKRRGYVTAIVRDGPCPSLPYLVVFDDSSDMGHSGMGINKLYGSEYPSDVRSMYYLARAHLYVEGKDG